MEEILRVRISGGNVCGLAPYTCLTFAIALLFVTRGKSYHGLGAWVLGLLLISIVNPILIHNTFIPEVLWIPISNLTVTATYIMLYVAITELRELPNRRALSMLMLFASFTVNALSYKLPPIRMVANACVYITQLSRRALKSNATPTAVGCWNGKIIQPFEA